MTTEPDPTPVTRPAPTGYRYAGAWIRLFALISTDFCRSRSSMCCSSSWAAFYLAYPQAADSVLADLDSTTWPAGLLAYIVLSVVMLAWYGGWQAGVGATPGMLVLKLRVRDPNGEDNPSLRAAVIRNSPQASPGSVN